MKIGEYFIKAGKLNDINLQKALEIQKEAKTFIGEILVYEQMVSEEDVLSYLGDKYNIQFITTQKLQKLSLMSHLSGIIPLEIARKMIIFPLKYNRSESRLTLVTFTPQGVLNSNDLQTNLQDVKYITPVIALSRSILALISKQYLGDLKSFDQISYTNISRMLTDDILSEEDSSLYEITMVDSGKNTQSTNQSFSLGTNDTLLSTLKNADTSYKSISNDTIELMRIFTSLLDMSRDDKFKGHSQRVYLLSKKIAKNIKLSKTETHSLLIAALLHDVGKKRHLTALEIQEGTLAQKFKKYSTLASSLFNDVELPQLAISYLSKMYETANGQGYPERLREHHVPVGSMILQMVHTFDYMTAILKKNEGEVFAYLEKTGFFPKKIVYALQENPGLKNELFKQQTEAKSGLLITSDIEIAEQLITEFASLDIKLIVTDRVEKGAILIKEELGHINFVLSDLNIEGSTISPIKLLGAIKRKEAFEDLSYFIFSLKDIDAHTIAQLRTHRVTAVLPEFSPLSSISVILNYLESQ